MGVKNLVSIYSVLLLLVGLGLNSGCAKKLNDISKLNPDESTDKSSITGCAAGAEETNCLKTYQATKTFMSANEELDAAGVIPGFHADLGFVQFVVTYDQLQVRRVGEANRDDGKASIVAAFPITDHYDIIRERNDYGEDTNKIIEDKTKPWWNRQYMRVQWGENLVKSTSLQNIFSTSIQEEGARRVSPLKREGGLISFDVDASVTQTEQLELGDGEFWQDVTPALRAHIKTTFLEVKPTDFKAYEMPNKDFGRFGYFRTYENFINPDKGVTVSGRKLYANRFNVCEKTDKTKRLSCSRNQIVYTLNEGFTEEYREAAQDAVKAWNTTFQKALDRTDDVVVLNEKVQPQIGDTRHSMIAVINEKVPTGLLGVSQTTNNPHTGETLSARSTIYLGAVRSIANDAAEKFDLLLLDFMKAKAKSEKAAKPQVFSIKSQKFDKAAAQKLLSQLKLSAKVLKTEKFKSEASLKRITPSAIKALSRKVVESQGRATARREAATQLGSSFLDISDAAWRISKQKDPALSEKSFLQLGKSAKRSRYQELSLAEKGVHSSEFVEPAVELFIIKFIMAHQDQDLTQLRETLKREVRKMVFYTTLLHEMGHNFGLRHNFGGSSDSNHYADRYYELEKEKQLLAQENPDDPRIYELSVEQESYDFSSVMDYAGHFYEALGGTGPYDLAAIRFGYNTSIDRSGDPIVGIVQNYKFCTDHQVFEDLMCQRWDKGTNVNSAVTRNIDDYNRSFYTRNLRRDRANFGDAGAYFNRVLIRTMWPIRQTSDEFIYRLIVSPQVAAADTECSIKFIKDSVDSGEMGNICDPAVVQTYLNLGVDLSDWGQLVVFLLKDDLSGFRKDPSTYSASGFADLLLANYFASQFFVNVIGSPEPGLYFPMPNATGYELEALPPIGDDDETKVKAFLVSKGISAEQAGDLAQQLKGQVVELAPGSQAKPLLSSITDDGGFMRVEVMGNLLDKLAAVIMMGYRGLPVMKYELISLNTNMYFSPQTKNIVTGLYNALITDAKQISSQTVQTRDGSLIDAIVPASTNLNTKVYGIFLAFSDLISDQSQEFSDKIRICTDNDRHCANPFGLPEVSFRGVNAQDFYKTIQVLTGDSIAYNIVEKGHQISKDRDQAVDDINNRDKLVGDINALLTGSAEQSPALRQKQYADYVAAQDKDLATKLGAIFGAESGLWKNIVDHAADSANVDAGVALAEKEAIPTAVTEANRLIAKAKPEVKKQVVALLKPVIKDMTDLNALTVRVAASGQIFQQSTEGLTNIESDARLIRTISQLLGVQ